MRTLGTTLALVLVAGCSDAVGPAPANEVSLQLSVTGPQLVSEQEITALGDAFDRVDSYVAEVVDTAGPLTVTVDTIPIPSGSAEHVLDIGVPEAWVGQTLRITLIAYAGTQELYRSQTFATIGEELGSVRLSAEIRYTGPGIRGVITDVQGAPLGGVTVELLQGASPVQTAVTEDDGTYLFVGVSTGQYVVQPTPPGQNLICPVARDVTIATVDDVIVTNFAESTDCTVRALVLSGGDVDDTETVRALVDPAVDVIADTTFFHVNQLPTLDFLSRFDVVLVMMNGIFDESASLGNRIAEYVGAGGNVVVASFYFQGRSDAGTGSVGWGALETLDPFNSLGGATYQPVTLGQILVASHPVMAGVNSLDSNSYSSGVEAKVDATVIAEWSDGAPLVGFRTGPVGQRIVGVSLFPAATQTVSGDVAVFWQNVVRWAGEPGGP